MKRILVTGGCGFIGSCFILRQINQGNFVINIDALTYAANLDNLSEVATSKNYHFVEGNICDQELISKLLVEFNIDILVNFAAESHVDNSIKNPGEFINTNIVGTFSLLNSALNYYQTKKDFKFIHISTDEVYGTLTSDEDKFSEESNYKPNSPYSASKASSDHLVRAWFETYKLPVMITNCSNNFGSNQHDEKFIPTVIRNCVNNKQIPIYGNGKNIRDWIYVEDHSYGIELAIAKGQFGQSYCFGGDMELKNIDLANKICEILDEIKPRDDKKSYKDQINFVTDRKGHDFRYAIDSSKAKKELGFEIKGNFEDKLKETINFYLK